MFMVNKLAQMNIIRNSIKNNANVSAPALCAVQSFLTTDTPLQRKKNQTIDLDIHSTEVSDEWFHSAADSSVLLYRLTIKSFFIQVLTCNCIFTE